MNTRFERIHLGEKIFSKNILRVTICQTLKMKKTSKRILGTISSFCGFGLVQRMKKIRKIAFYGNGNKDEMIKKIIFYNLNFSFCTTSSIK